MKRTLFARRSQRGGITIWPIAAAVEGDERLERLIDAAEKGIERGEKLTSQLLAFARKQALRPQLCNVNSLLKEFDILAGRMLGNAVELAIELDPAVGTCEIDSTQFTSALLNLVANAGDAGNSGGKVIIRTGNAVFDNDALPAAAEGKTGAYVMVSVQDNGMGMTPDVVARATEPFCTTKEVGKGPGLGLSQVYPSAAAPSASRRRGVGLEHGAHPVLLTYSPEFLCRRRPRNIRSVAGFPPLMTWCPS